MLKKLTSLTLVAALVSLFCCASAFANNSSDLDVRTDTSTIPSGISAKTDSKPNEHLRNNMLKLVGDAKSGKVLPAAKSQIQPAKSNRWSNGTKIAVGVGVAVAVIAVIVIVKAKDSPGRVL